MKNVVKFVGGMRDGTLSYDTSAGVKSLDDSTAHLAYLAAKSHGVGGKFVAVAQQSAEQPREAESQKYEITAFREDANESHIECKFLDNDIVIQIASGSRFRPMPGI